MRSYPKISESQLEHYSHHQSTSPAMKSNHDRQATHVRRYEVLTAFHKFAASHVERGKTRARAAFQ